MLRAATLPASPIEEWRLMSGHGLGHRSHHKDPQFRPQGRGWQAEARVPMAFLPAASWIDTHGGSGGSLLVPNSPGSRAMLNKTWS